MKHIAVVVSDNHGDLSVLQTIRERHHEAPMFHCGDFVVNKWDLPLGLQAVRGNCDFELGVPEELRIKWGEWNILMVHGHRQGVKSSPLGLKYKAEEEKVDLVLFGHSHYPVCFLEEGRVYINPGSLLLPRGYVRPTYAVLQWDPSEFINGAEKGCKGVLEVSFYNVAGEKETSLSRSYTRSGNGQWVDATA
jgi:putative phosphoesterase